MPVWCMWWPGLYSVSKSLAVGRDDRVEVGAEIGFGYLREDGFGFTFAENFDGTCRFVLADGEWGRLWFYRKESSIKPTMNQESYG